MTAMLPGLCPWDGFTALTLPPLPQPLSSRCPHPPPSCPACRPRLNQSGGACGSFCNTFDNCVRQMALGGCVTGASAGCIGWLCTAASVVHAGGCHELTCWRGLGGLLTPTTPASSSPGTRHSRRPQGSSHPPATPAGFQGRGLPGSLGNACGAARQYKLAGSAVACQPVAHARPAPAGQTSGWGPHPAGPSEPRRHGSQQCEGGRQAQRMPHIRPAALCRRQGGDGRRQVAYACKKHACCKKAWGQHTTGAAQSAGVPNPPAPRVASQPASAR